MEKPTVKLTGINGNAFVIMATISKALKKAGYSPEQLKQYQKESMEVDNYNLLLQVAEKWVNVT